MKFTCNLPVEGSGPDGFQSIAKIGAAAKALEDAGVDACFVTDHPAPTAKWLAASASGAHETLDPFVALTAAAAATSTIKLHTNILVLAYRNPFIVAKMAATLDAISGGRMLLGVGVGYLEAEYDAVGVPFAERGAITDIGIRTLREALTGKPVTAETKYFKAAESVVGPAPVQAGGIPIWAGGNSKRAIRRAVELCDGWSPFPAPAVVTTFAGTDKLETLDDMRAKVAYLRELMDKVGRTRPIDISTGRFGENGQLGHSAMPDAAKAVDDYCQLAEVGVSWCSINLPSPDPVRFAELAQWYGEEVIAKVRAQLG